MNKFILILFALFIVSTNSNAEWSKDKIDATTIALQEYSEAWSVDDTVRILNQASESGQHSENLWLGNEIVKFSVIGDSILINGKEVTGNFGKKETHGDYSPIIENIDNSKIAIGPEAKINEESINTKIEKKNHSENTTIVENAKDSNIAVGSQPKISDESKNTNIYINLTISIALTFSLLINIYLIFKSIKRKNKSI